MSDQQTLEQKLLQSVSDEDCQKLIADEKRNNAEASNEEVDDGPDGFTLDGLIANIERSGFVAAAESQAVLKALRSLRARRASERTARHELCAIGCHQARLAELVRDNERIMDEFMGRTAEKSPVAHLPTCASYRVLPRGECDCGAVKTNAGPSSATKTGTAPSNEGVAGSQAQGPPETDEWRAASLATDARNGAV